MNIFAATGMLNTAAVAYAWYSFLTDYLNNTSFWFAWLGVVGVNGFLWVPIFIAWPVLFFAGSTTINVIAFLVMLTLAGAYVAYWIVLSALVYTSIVEPQSSGSTFASTSDAYVHVFGYAGLSLFNAFISIFFAPDVFNFRDAVNRVQELAKQKAEAEAAA